MKKHIFILLAFLLPSVALHAENEIDSVKVYFRVSHTEIDPDFHDNGVTLDSIFHKLSTDSRLYGPTRRLSSVTVTGAASPEGSVQFNRYLSEKRAGAIFDEFRSRGLLTD
ncbi:MAG: hypothetical protein K2I92_10000, partial [Muribaculaceae bacterium]|nr:hypothetical protein [Muribaculaceae bacterium]